MTAIYKIRNVVNGKFYVGSTVDTRVRFQCHRRQLRKGVHHCRPLQHAWSKYGEDCFKFEVVERVENSADLFPAENRWLEEHHGRPYCYNLSKCAEAFMRGMKFTDEHKAKIAASNKGNQSSKGIRRTLEECEAIRRRAIGNTHFLGKEHSPSAKERISRAQKGKRHRLGHKNSPEHRQRISDAMKGKKKSPEHAEKIRQRMIGTSYAKGRVVTDEQKVAMGKAVVELGSGLEFITVAAAAAHFGIERANLVRTMRNGGDVKRGPKAGLSFRYK